MSTEIILKNLGSLLPGRINYSETVNAFLSEAYVSLANNVYFSTIRFGENLIIKEDVGQGHTHAFLNGIRIFSIKEKVLLVDKGFNSQIYSKEIAQREIKSLLLDLIKDAAKNAGYHYDQNDASKAVENIIQIAYSGDQREIAQVQLRKALPGH